MKKRRVYVAYRDIMMKKGGKVYESVELCVSYDEFECEDVIFNASLRLSQHDRECSDMYVAWYDLDCNPGETALAAYNRAWAEGRVF